MDSHHELERKYEVTDAVRVPDLAALPKVATVERPREVELEAVYFDTADHELLRAGITLRRRTGGDDEGWHLKLPAGPDEREELRQPIRRGAAPGTVPKALRSLVQVHARGRTLVPVATVRTRRVVHRLLAEDGTPVAELCDDTVTSEVPDADGSVTASSWREWEVELVQGPRKVLAVADELLLGAGARPARAASKLSRALGTPGGTDPELTAREPSARGPAGVVLLAHLREQAETLKAFDPQVRRDRPDAVHRMRVSTRRLRSALATFGPLLEPEFTDAVRAELTWLAGVLGTARDAEVMRDRLVTMAAEDTDGSGLHGVADDLSRQLDERYRAAHAEALHALRSRRYFRLLDSVDALLDAPPWTSTAAKRARKVLPALVRHEWRRVRKRAQQGTRLHETRKAAKRLRYACEALTPVFGAQAVALARAAEQLQEVLGEHQDSVVSQALTRELAGRAGLSGDAVLVLGRLHLLEQEHAERAHVRYSEAWKELSDKRLRRWLKA